MSGIERTPTMTANNLPSPYVASASNEAGGSAYLAFDKADSQWIANTNNTQWIKFDFGIIRWACDEYRWTCQGADRAPNTWTFEGSNDDSSWTTLSSHSGITWSDFETKTFTVTNTKAFRYYRWSISTINGGTNVEADEISIFAPQRSGGALMSFI